MKKAYRILAILLCLSMLFALAACSAKQENTTEDQKPDETATETTDTAEPSGDAPASEEAPEEMTLSVAWWGGAARNERIEKTLDLYSELNPNVSFSTATNNFSDHYTAMATAAASSDLPDMWLLSASLWLNQFAGSNQLLDLTPYIESGALDVRFLRPFWNLDVRMMEKSMQLVQATADQRCSIIRLHWRLRELQSKMV